MSLSRLLHPFILLLTIGLSSACAGSDAVPAPRIPAGKRVSLRADGLALGKVLADLDRQTGLRVQARLGGSDPRVTVELKDVSFWEALDRIAAAAGARVDLYSAEGRIILVPRAPGYRPPPVSYSGPFRTTFKKLVTARDLEAGSHTCTAFLEVAWEPDLEPYFLETRPQGIVFQDSRGKGVPVPGAGSSPAPVGGLTALVCDVALPALPRSEPQIGLLQGRLGAIAPSKMLTFTFDTLDQLRQAKPGGAERRQTKDGVVCSISEVRLDKSRWTVQVSVEYPPGGLKLDSSQAQSLVAGNEMVLQAKDGAGRFASGSYVITVQSPRRAVVSYHFLDRDKLRRTRPADWKVVYRTPASIVEVPFTFSFKDVKLP